MTIINSKNSIKFLFGCCIILFVIFVSLGIYNYLKKNSTTPTTAPPQVSSISNSLAQLITSSLNNNVEYFTSFPVDIQQQIAKMLDNGDIKGVENLINSQGLTLSQVIRDLIKISEVNNIDMISDGLVKQISKIMKAQNELSGIQIEINFLENIVKILYTGTTPDPSIIAMLDSLNSDLVYYKNIIDTSPPLQSLINQITDSEILSHILEIQTRLQNLHKKRFVRLLKDIKNKYIGRGTIPPYITGSTNNLINLLARYIKNYNDDDNKNIKDNSDTLNKKPERIKFKDDDNVY